eukprot:CAMPEP_0172163276 /NCGR_PEP_ID=MMETSP1050-20130122/7179_1 /TAXON_ID=233186 /ORGANISM="Cryptomonas curvata, Strain CCAP979/52" /LENGTH=116 /DNA_ID=CAMNT_0012833443 /DNA_START=178 /DNA_END=525 /DNA_ORIENTATION=+
MGRRTGCFGLGRAGRFGPLGPSSARLGCAQGPPRPLPRRAHAARRRPSCPRPHRSAKANGRAPRDPVAPLRAAAGRPAGSARSRSRSPAATASGLQRIRSAPLTRSGAALTAPGTA